jgi:alpha-amylase/alpha-mannosidase (GH57 family)
VSVRQSFRFVPTLIDWLLQSDQKPLEPQKTFCQNLSLPSASGQNKTLKLCQNNVVINTRLLAGARIPAFAGMTTFLKTGSLWTDSK